MKEGIHPKYGKAIVRCVCGETFETGSTKSELKVDICSKCHPFFTGKQKLVDTGGRVDKFKKRYNIDSGLTAYRAIGTLFVYERRRENSGGGGFSKRSLLPRAPSRRVAGV